MAAAPDLITRILMEAGFEVIYTGLLPTLEVVVARRLAGGCGPAGHQHPVRIARLAGTPIAATAFASAMSGHSRWSPS